MSNAVHVYVSQAHKGELVMGAGIDALQLATPSAARSTSSSDQMAAALELFPIFARAHVLRTWAGIVDVSPDASPIIGPDARSTACSSTAAGAPAGSRRRPASGWVYARHDRARRAAPAGRAVRARRASRPAR